MLARAISASSGTISNAITRCDWWASKAAIKPEPAPTSSTLSCFCRTRSCSMRASTRGASMHLPSAMLLEGPSKGISRSAKARDLWANGTKSSRRTWDSNSSTSRFSTFQGRICCSIMLKRAWAVLLGRDGTGRMVMVGAVAMLKSIGHQFYGEGSMRSAPLNSRLAHWVKSSM